MDTKNDESCYEQFVWRSDDTKAVLWWKVIEPLHQEPDYAVTGNWMGQDSGMGDGRLRTVTHCFLVDLATAHEC